MKKLFSLLLTVLMVLTLAACGNEPADDHNDVNSGSPKDLTVLTAEEACHELYHILGEPDKLVGTEIKMSGEYVALEGTEAGVVYHICVVSDPDTGESQGMEFILMDGAVYPDLGDTFTLAGTLEIYEENGDHYCHLVDAEIVD